MTFENFIKSEEKSFDMISSYISTIGGARFFEEFFGEKSYWEILKKSKKMAKICGRVNPQKHRDELNQPKTKLGKMIKDDIISRYSITQYIEKVGGEKFVSDYFNKKSYTELVSYALEVRKIKGIDAIEKREEERNRLLKKDAVFVRHKGKSIIQKTPDKKIYLTLVDDADIQDDCYKIPNGVTHIDTGAFRDKYSLKKVIIPPSVVYIGTSAFDRCFHLTTLSIKEEKTRAEMIVASTAFKNCDKEARFLARLKKLGHYNIKEDTEITPN